MAGRVYLHEKAACGRQDQAAAASMGHGSLLHGRHLADTPRELPVSGDGSYSMLSTVPNIGPLVLVLTTITMLWRSMW